MYGETVSHPRTCFPISNSADSKLLTREDGTRGKFSMSVADRFEASGTLGADGRERIHYAVAAEGNMGVLATAMYPKNKPPTGILD